ncbi:MAG: hypothetical protein H6718_05550 [Polyangiaceae bacterium]|nr:hypothetical protein [Myxococcales bacterium]MCB9584839.1 hypothetical protein [Polyangiaceae bacterium]MCB9607588.1 hypothetical protein [Polyangiaceae bacterium]
MATLFAVYRDHAHAERAVAELMRLGVDQRRLSLFLTEEVSGLIPKVRPAVPEGAVAGGALGALLAGIGGIATLALPGLGLVVAGPLAVALESAVVGAVGGGFAGALIGIGVPENQAKRYAESLLEHGVIVAASPATPDEAQLIEAVFEDTRGVDLVRAQHPGQSVSVSL